MSAQSRPLVRESGDWILNTIKRNPEGLLLLAAGAVLMLRTGTTQSRDVSEDDSESPARSAPAEAVSKVADAVTNTTQRAMDAASSYASAASDTARQTMDTAKSYASSAADYAGQTKRKVGEQSDRIVRQTKSMTRGVLQNQPLAILGAGLAVGAALAAAFPPTEIEKETLGPVGEQASKAAARVGEQLKQATMKAGERLKSAAEERGLHTDGLKEVAEEVADTFKASMRGEANKVTDDESPAGQYHTADRS
jgi:hypothetical protein